MRVLFAIATMTGGGAERVASLLANAWAAEGVETHLVTYHRDRTEFFYPVCDRVRHLGLDAFKRRGVVDLATTNFRRIRGLRRAVSDARPDVVVSFMTEMNVLTLMATALGGPPVVISERVHPAHIDYGRARSALRRRLYPRAAALVTQTEPIADWFRAWGAGGATDAPVVLPNPVDLETFAAAGPPAVAADRRLMLAVGRLERQKGFDLLIDAFADIAAARPEWDLEIVGDGSERAALESQIAAHGLESRARLAGVTSNVAAALARADLYVHPARFEGYPNALMEALAAGRATVAADAPGGAAEILGRGRHGALAPCDDAKGLADALRELTGDPALRASYAAAARAAVAHLDLQAVAGRWLDLFERVRAEG